MEDKITLSELVDLVAARAELSKQETEDFLKSLFETVENALSTDEWVKIKDFGTFKLTPVKARESVDVNTGEKIEIPAHNRIGFSPATVLKELVNKPFAHFETVLLNEGVSLEGIETETETETDEEPEAEPIKTPVLTPQAEVEVEAEKEQTADPELPKLENYSIHPAFEEPKPRKKRAEILIPILGGIAIALAGFFLYSGEPSGKKR